MKDDVFFRFGPTVRLSDEDSRLSWNLSYRPVYEKYVEFDNLDHLNHFASGEVRYQLTNRTAVFAQDHFSFTQSVNRFESGDTPATEPDIETSGTHDITRNIARIGLEHTFTPRLFGNWSANYNYFDSESSNTSQNTSISSTGSMSYALSARDRVGGGVGFTYQDFKQAFRNPGSESYTYRVFGTYTHTFSEDTELTVQLGPAFIDNKQNKVSAQTAVPIPFVSSGPNAVTFAQAYSAAGLGNVPANAFDASFPNTPLPTSILLQPNSVLVPSQNLCINSGNCSLVSFIRGDGSPTMPDAVQVSGQAQQQLSFLPGFEPDDNSNLRIALFGEVRLTHRWTPRLSSAVSYSRDDSSASSLGSTTIADRVSLQTTWNPAERWNFNVRGDWVRRESANDQNSTTLAIGPTATTANNLPTAQYIGLRSRMIDNSVDTQYWSASVRAAYRVIQRGTLTFRVTYQKQDNANGSSTSDADFGNVIAFVGFRYDFDPFRF